MHSPTSHQLVRIAAVEIVVVVTAVAQGLVWLSPSQQERVWCTVVRCCCRRRRRSHLLQATGSTPVALAGRNVLDPLSSYLLLIIAQADVGAEGKVLKLVQLCIVRRVDVVGWLLRRGGCCGRGHGRVPRGEILHTRVGTPAGSAVPVVENISENEIKDQFSRSVFTIFYRIELTWKFSSDVDWFHSRSRSGAACWFRLAVADPWTGRGAAVCAQRSAAESSCRPWSCPRRSACPAGWPVSRQRISWTFPLRRSYF